MNRGYGLKKLTEENLEVDLVSIINFWLRRELKDW